MHRNVTRRGLRAAVLWMTLAAAACAEPDLTVPTADQAREVYANPDVEVTVRGNVVELRVPQPREQLRRGGTLWAKVGPYIFLFSEATESLFDDYPGLAGVRVITTAGNDGPEVARAFMERDDMNDILWNRAKVIAGRARLEGSKRPSLVEELIRWGEDHTDFEYNPRYVSSR
ncbi:MAG: hypothetical protein D6701_05680 [Gemmatimonadetes bacterium]|nr:MAG: hypothetical protein D6701_05680 [Gemmatimonadota bacterium]